ncbi:hydroxysqualene dehydroxylase HpnE [Candidatus Zixiibacteriota bacterium]
MSGGSGDHPVDGRLPYAVAGGGVAGLAAAEALTRAGERVILLEQRNELGGRISSFRDPDSGWYLDNGQHIWMQCCNEFTDFLTRTGVSDLTCTQPRLRVTFLERDRRAAVLEALKLPTPFHLLLPLLAFSPLRPGDRVALLRGLISLKLSGTRLLAEGGERRFGEWLIKQRQPASVISRFWEPVITSILNQQVREVRTDLAAMAIRNSFLAGKGDANLAWMSQPHGNVWERVATALEERGATIRRGTKVARVELAGGLDNQVPRLSAIVLAGGEHIAVAGAVMAVPPGTLRECMPPELQDTSHFRQGTSLAWSPILNLHLWYEKPVTGEPLLCILNSPLQWVFAKPGQSPDGGRNPVPSSAQHLNLVVSSSHRFLGQDDRQTTALLLDELSSVLPETRSTRLLASKLIHETRATFSALPGSEQYRPPQKTTIPGLAIAGAWTATGWPSTLEGAVRSGREAVHSLGVSSP